ncbi:trypco2 family protein [Amycolatopsis sp. NPDC004747]
MTETEFDEPLAMDEYGVSLEVALSRLRAELQEAMVAGENERIRFVPESVEVELEIVAKKTRSANGNVKMWAVSVGGSGANERSATHRLRLKLKPRDMSLADPEQIMLGR